MELQLQEMFKKMGSGEMKAYSELGTRDESKQSLNYGPRIQKMKTVTGINARLLVMKDVVLPFNPFTLASDDNYNSKTPFRPILLVSQVIEGIKSACRDNPVLAEGWEKLIGITFSDGPATMEEYKAFKSKGYIKPRVMSYPTVAMRFGGIFGFPEFRAKYTVDTSELNKNNSYDYENAPIWHLGAIFFRSMLKPEFEDRKKKLEANGQSKDTIAKEKDAIFSKSPVDTVKPSNIIPFLYLPFGELPMKLDPEHPQEIIQLMRYYSYTEKWTVPLKEAMENPMYDEIIDFFEFTIKTPSSKDVKKNNQVYTDNDAFELYGAMTINTTDGRLSLKGGKTVVDGEELPNEEVFANLLETARAYFLFSQEQSGIEGGETFEKIMATSNNFRPITAVLNNFLPACNEIFNSTFAASPYFTEQVKKANAEFLVAMNADNAMALADYDDDELNEAKEDQRATIAEILEETVVQTGDNSILGLETMDLEEMDLHEG